MIRFYFIVLFFLISLLALFKAPEYHLWLLSIGVTEFPLVFFVISLLITLTGFWAHKFQMTGTVIGVITMLICLSPILRAYWVATYIKEGMSESFKGIPGVKKPIPLPIKR
jgi:Na+/proline symporter